MAGRTNEDDKELLGVPKVCQYKNLCSAKNEQIPNENPDWLKDQGLIPLWSPLNHLTCTGQPRENSKCEENNFMIEIPDRLLSLFGPAIQQTDCIDKMETRNNCHLMINMLALCAALKNDFCKWSEELMDKITTSATRQYPDFLKQHSVTDKEVNISHLNGLLQFDGDEYRAQIHQVATGFLYIPYGLNQFNLARALHWFFSRYQFGFVKCGQRTLVVGKLLTNEYDFFMYDCQSCGYPMFAEQQSNSYILRTPYLQILHYCLLKTLNFATKIKFFLYNADITIIDRLEGGASKPRLNHFITTAAAKDQLGKNAASSIAPKVKKFVPKTAPKNTQQKPGQKGVQKNVRTNSIAPKASAPNSATNSMCKTLSSQDTNRKLILDPNKMYYIVAVPKTKITSEHLMARKDGMSCGKILGNDRINKQQSKEFEVETFLKSINLEEAASTTTLTSESVEANESPDLKVYLVENEDSGKHTATSSENKIKIAHQIKDFSIK